MSKTTNLNRSFVYKRFKDDLTARFGERKAQELWSKAQEELRRLETEYPDEEKGGFVFPAVALYRVLENNAPGEALELTRAYGTKTGIRIKGILQKITALPGMPNLIWRKMDLIAKKMSDGYQFENFTLTEHLCTMDVKECPLYECAKRLGAPEAAQMICCMDKEYMTGMRGVAYQRTKSLAEGDECCDYRLEDRR